MDDLRELDARCAELLVNVMPVLGYSCCEVAIGDGIGVIYKKPTDYKEGIILRSCSFGKDEEWAIGKTRHEARTRAAVRAMEGSGENETDNTMA